jgi:transposase-like protein
MNLKRQWCASSKCADYGQMDAGNIQVFSYVEGRYYCTTCGSTFSADKGTVFETLRSPQLVVLEALNLLTERNSLRAVERLNHHSPNRLLEWLERAGAHGAAVSAELIQNLHLTHVQIDELWTFVKKSKNIVCSMTHRMWVTCGSGGRSRCPVDCGS